LAQRLAGRRFAGIVAVARGGLVPAALLARDLDMRMVDTICVASYDGRRRGPVDILKCPAGDGADWLVIDDLADSGATLAAVRARLPAAHFATLYAKPEGKPFTDTYVAEVPQTTWLVFPWETENKNISATDEHR
jgi:xanthine phosphoribosyltransferase